MITSRASSPGGWIVASMRRSRTSSRKSDIAATAFQARRPVERPIDDEVDADCQCYDGRTGNERRRNAEDNTVLVFLHHRTPIGDRRLHAEAEEGKRGEEQHRE